MLTLPTGPRWNDAPSGPVGAFRDFVAERLGGAWTVGLTAYDNDAPTTWRISLRKSEHPATTWLSSSRAMPARRHSARRHASRSARPVVPAGSRRSKAALRQHLLRGHPPAESGARRDPVRLPPRQRAILEQCAQFRIPIDTPFASLTPHSADTVPIRPAGFRAAPPYAAKVCNFQLPIVSSFRLPLRYRARGQANVGI